MRRIATCLILCVACTSSGSAGPPSTTPATTTVPTTTTTTTTTTAVPSPASRLAVDDGRSAYVVTVDGEGREPLTGALLGSQPTWSRDGRRIAWTAGTTDEPIVAVRTGPVDDAHPAPFLPFYYSWDPTNRRLAMLGNGSSGTIELAVLDTADGSFTTLAGGAPFYFDWSPDGTQIVQHVGTDTLRIMDLEGAVLHSQPSRGEYQAPQWTADGVVWQESIGGSISARGLAHLQSEQQQIRLGEPGAEWRVIAEPSGFTQFGLAGDRLAYLETGAGAGGALWLVDENGPQLLAEDGVLGFQWNRQGSAVAWLELVTGDIVQARWVVWAPEQTITFETHTPTPGFVTRYLPFWDQYARSSSIWSPDGEAFVFTRLDADDGALVFVQPVDEDAPSIRIGPGEVATWSYGSH